jgi:transcriptional regulator with PAS, ATPase and Fis domain
MLFSQMGEAPENGNPGGASYGAVFKERAINISPSWVLRRKPEGGYMIIGDRYLIEIRSGCCDSAVLSERAAGTISMCMRIIRSILPVAEMADYQEWDDDLSEAGEGMKFDPPLIGCSEGIAKLKKDIRRVAQGDISVLIEGESGTGKEIVARNIHRFSRRSDGPLINVNCAGIQPSLLRAELFGFRRGSFTGAAENRAGLVECAAGGTLFLDEVGEMPPDLQAALLRVIQEKEVRRVGESRTRCVDVRFLFATNRDLTGLVSSGSFRKDLFFRICGLRLEIEPLREREKDIIPLFLHFLREFARKEGVRTPRLSATAARKLLFYDWPGNVRELINESERIITMYRGRKMISASMLSSRITRKDQSFFDSPAIQLKEAVERLERKMITGALNRYGGNRSKSARKLGISRQGLINKINRYQLDNCSGG